MPKSKPKSFQISSNFTLVYKLALPIFWTVFFGGFTVMAFKSRMYESFNTTPGIFKASAALFFILGVLLLFFTLWQLKRVEFAEKDFYVTNYFKHVRYTYDSIASVNIINIIFFKLMIIKLAQKGILGRKLPLLASRKRLRLFKEAYPELGDKLGL